MFKNLKKNDFVRYCLREIQFILQGALVSKDPKYAKSLRKKDATNNTEV